LGLWLVACCIDIAVVIAVAITVAIGSV
jgi:hypothetical protein